MSQQNSKQEIGQWASTSLVVGNMIGSGIFLLPASLAVYGGISLFGWILSAIGALMLAKVFATLSKKIPKVGGPYAYSKHGFGDFAGFLVAWGYWISICCTNAAIAVAMMSYLTVFFPSLSNNPTMAVLVGLSVIWLLTWVNSRGVKEAAWVQLVTTILKITPLVVVAFVGLFFIELEHFQPINLSEESNFSAIITTATLTLFAFLGIESATIPSENIKSPNTTIPKATLWGTWIAIVVYIFGSISVMGVIPPEVLVKSNAPFADAAAILWGDSAKYWVAAGAVISTFGALNGWILMQGQIPLAAAKDNLFPSIFGKLGQRGTPVRGIVLSSILISILMVMNYTKGFVKAFEFMILLSTLTVLVPYLFSSATHIMLALNEKSSKRGSWILGSLAFLFSMLAVVGSGEEVVFYGFLFLMAGIPFYVVLKDSSP